MAGVKPMHHDPKKVEQLNQEVGNVKDHYNRKSSSLTRKQLFKAGAIGAFKGGLIGLSSGLLLRLISKTYRNVRTPVRVFYHATWISMGIVFWAEKQVLVFEDKLYAEENERRGRILDEAAERGIFLEDDRRSLDDGLHRPDLKSTK